MRVGDWQNVITVNMLGNRFYDETGRQYTANNYKGVDPYIHGHYTNAQNIRWSRRRAGAPRPATRPT